MYFDRFIKGSALPYEGTTTGTCCGGVLVRYGTRIFGMAKGSPCRGGPGSRPDSLRTVVLMMLAAVGCPQRLP